MMTLAAEATNDNHLILAIVGLGFSVITTIGGVGFWIVSQLTNVRSTMESKHNTYDSILETVVGKQAILESKHNSLDNRQTVTETRLEGIPHCAARDPEGYGKPPNNYPRRTQ